MHRKDVIGIGGLMGAAARLVAAGAAITLAGTDAGHQATARRTAFRRSFGAPFYKAYFKAFHPVINRWTGKPHEHKREIARRTRQAARIAARQGLDGGA